MRADPGKVTSRDVALLRDLWRYRYLSTSQIARLHFGRHIKLAQRRLRRLTALDVVDRFRVGSRAWWYRLARRGARAVAEAQGLAVEAVVPPARHPRTLAFLAHHALVTNVRVWVREGCARREFGYRFVPSYEEVREEGRCRRRVAVALSGRRVLVPDGALVLERGGTHVLFLLEVDRGTEPLTGRHPSAIERKLAAYAAAFDARAEQAYAELFGVPLDGFRVLCVVPDERRRRGFLEVAARQDLIPLVWVALAAVFEEPGDLDVACWAVRPGAAFHLLTE